MNKVYFTNVFSPCYKKIATKLFSDAVEKNYSLNKNFFANVKFVSEEEIQKLNNEFRNINRVTDVLSFPNYEIPKEEFFEDDDVFLGDIAICKSIARKQAKEYGHSLKRELCFLFLHGFLHIMGYDHIEKADEEKMMKLANEILSENGVERWKQDMLLLLEEQMQGKAR